MKRDFSVLMSIYCKETPEYLNEALDSILKQSLIPNEVVIVKDGPLTTELEVVINSFTEKFENTVVIPLKENVGLGKALSIGVKACKYKIIARMDSDDIAKEDRFLTEIDCLIKNNLDIIGSNIEEFVKSNNEVVSHRRVPETQDEILKFSRTRNPFNHMTVMFKKDVVLKSGNYKEMKGFEDYYLWLRMIKSGAQVFNLQKNLVSARTDQNFLERRSGVGYFKSEYHFQKIILHEGLISNYDFCKNIIIRCSARLVPKKILKQVYVKYVHSNK